MDVLTRAIAQQLSVRWKQPVIVDNRGGAGGIIGTQAVAIAPPNGETLLATIDSPFTANRFLYKQLPYDPDTSFRPVGMLARAYGFLVAHPSLAAANLRELVALARKQAGGLNYGSYGSGSHPHLLYSMLSQREGVMFNHVPYKGIAPLIAAMLANEVPLSAGSAAVTGAQIRAGKIKALGYCGPRRNADFPDVPTTAEQGFGYLVSPIWLAVFAPAGTPSAIVDKVNADLQAIVRDPEFVRLHIAPMGYEAAPGKPAQLAEAVRADSRLMGEMTAAAGLKPE